MRRMILSGPLALALSCSEAENTSDRCILGLSRECDFPEEDAGLAIHFKQTDLPWNKSKHECLGQEYHDKSFSNIDRGSCGFSGKEAEVNIGSETVSCSSGSISITYMHEVNRAIYRNDSKELEVMCKESGSNSPSN